MSDFRIFLREALFWLRYPRATSRYRSSTLHEKILQNCNRAYARNYTNLIDMCILRGTDFQSHMASRTEVPSKIGLHPVLHVERKCRAIWYLFKVLDRFLHGVSGRMITSLRTSATNGRWQKLSSSLGNFFNLASRSTRYRAGSAQGARKHFFG